MLNTQIHHLNETLNQKLLNLYNQNKFVELINLAEDHIKNKIFNAETYNLMGMASYNLQKFDYSILNFKRSIKLKPDYAEAFNYIGYPLKSIGKLDLAIENHIQAIKFKPDYIEAFINLALCYVDQKKFDQALKVFYRAKKLAPNFYDLHLNIASVLIEKEKYDKALKLFKKLLDKNPNDTRILNNLGSIYKAKGNFKKSLIFYKKAIKQDSNNMLSRWNLSYCSLYKFDFKNGWMNYNLRWKMKNKTPPEYKLDKPVWDGFSIGTVLIYPEQGIGDQILFSRCINYFQNKKNKFIFSTDKKLMTLFKSSFPKIKVVEHTENIKSDFCIGLGDLPKFCIKDIKSLNDLSKPYLFPMNSFNQNKINVLKRNLLCGLSWNSVNGDVGKNKSISLEQLKDIISLPKINFIDLQYSDTQDEINHFSKKYNINILTNQKIDNFNDMNALALQIQECDFIITISNSTAHLSGALGKKTFLMAPKGKGKYWYWSQKKNMCLWYPSVEVFQQKKRGVWDEVIEEIKSRITQSYITNNI